MRIAILGLVGGLLGTTLFGCRRSTPVTPPATKIFEWDSSKATRETFRTATVGARTSKDFKVTLGKESPTFVVDLHVDFAPVEFVEGGKSVHQIAPVAITGTVKSNDAWEVSATCEDGPNYQMGPVNAAGEMITPMGMIQSCYIRYHREAGIVFRSSWSLGTSINVNGDGKVYAFPDDEAKVE